MISVDINAIETFDVKLVPNAVETNNDVEVRFNVPEGNAQIGVFNMMGNPLMISQMKTNNGENVVIINTKGMVAGLYLIKIIHNGRAVTKKLVVK
jgi:putative heme iron utilization protein